MQLSLQTFTSLVQNMAAAVQAAAAQLLDLTVGSAMRAVLEANASVALWMQWMILQVLQTTRAATSAGPDLDSWMADMSLTRLPAVAAIGMVTFSRITPTATALIPAGALVRTADGSQTFGVTVDPTNPAWSAGSNGYVVAAGLASLTVAVAAQTSGSAGNVQAGSITLLASAIPGIDAVTNPAPMQNGLDAESDAALRVRFQNFVQSRSRATPLAVGYAVSSIQQGLSYVLQENVDPSGTARMGSFVITLDDGSGYPPASLLATATTAVEAVRPVGSTFTVQPPTVVVANVSMTLTVPGATNKPPVVAVVAQAIQTYINTLPIGATLPLTKLAQIAYGASPSVTNVAQLQINSVTSDLVPSLSGVVKAGMVAVS
ncbi:MAG TPA: baseplate J/gp47 family protein [Acetobacteraceae bacterium]|nr:baseplate J/gp47 family protein [Acetobacteraceae bacterium]